MRRLAGLLALMVWVATCAPLPPVVSEGVVAVATTTDSVTAAPPAGVPAWRGEPGTAWLGPDVLWRPREWLVFHLQDDAGGGFALDLTVRDMNLYMQGARPVHVHVTGPTDQILLRHEMPDDGITAGDPAQREGIYDTFSDFRYREWHRIHSPGGVPPGKSRSSLLRRPEILPARDLRLQVPDDGPGLYRVTVIASWDHWISLTPDRPLPTGVHPGPGPLALHGDRFASGAYLWIPSTTQHLNVSVSEEVQPFAASLALHDEAGELIARRSARTFQTYVVDEEPTHDSVYRVSVSGARPGACLHINGVPPVLAPDAETARRLHGGLTVDEQGRHTFYRHQRVLDRWVDGLTAEELADSNVAVAAAGRDYLRRLSPFAWYNTRDVSYRYDFDDRSPFTAAHRSGWYSLGLDSRGALNLQPAMEAGAQAGTIPDSVVAAWKTSLTLWAAGRSLMHMGETSNQWTYNLEQLLKVHAIAGDSTIARTIARDTKRLLTVGSLGRLNPDGPAEFIDLGRSPAGYMAEQQGWDGQYGQEQEANLRSVWDELPREDLHAAILDWWRDLYWLKGHITLPKHGVPTTDAFYGSVSPTDVNFRTRYYTHKTGLHRDVRDDVVFGDLWAGPDAPPPARPWPALEETPFVRSVADMFHFVNTGRYYAIVYAGPRVPAWPFFSRAVVEEGTDASDAVGTGGHVRLAGFNGPGYGAFGRTSTKVGALSALFVPGMGPGLLGSNHEVADAHTVWGRRHLPIAEVWRDADVDPRIVSAAYVQPEATFDASTRTYVLREELLYAPLAVERRLHFEDDRVVVDLLLEARGPVDLQELYLAVPFVADDRVARRFGEDFSELGLFAIPEGTVKETRSPQWTVEAQRFRHPDVVARAVDFAAPDGGPGMTLILPGQMSMMQAEPFRYREVALNQGSLNVPLPTTLAAGQRHEMRYLFYVHDGPVTPDDLRRVAAESGL